MHAVVAAPNAGDAAVQREGAVMHNGTKVQYSRQQHVQFVRKRMEVRLYIRPCVTNDSDQSAAT